MLDKAQKFTVQNKFKQVALEYVQVQLLAREETEQIDIVFRELDKKNNGVL